MTIPLSCRAALRLAVAKPTGCSMRCLMELSNCLSFRLPLLKHPKHPHERNYGLLPTPFGTSCSPIHACSLWWQRLLCGHRRLWRFWITFLQRSIARRSQEFRPSMPYSVSWALLLGTPGSRWGRFLWLIWSVGQTLRRSATISGRALPYAARVVAADRAVEC